MVEIFAILADFISCLTYVPSAQRRGHSRNSTLQFFFPVCVFIGQRLEESGSNNNQPNQLSNDF